jgi:hypothetical protein
MTTTTAYDRRHDPSTFPYGGGNYIPPTSAIPASSSPGRRQHANANANATNNNNNDRNHRGAHRRGRHRNVRCYRLNLERPRDIHIEQSPLEYGDYMSPWLKECRPQTVGPVEYCPPRHLGGRRHGVWNELMVWGGAGMGGDTGMGMAGTGMDGDVDVDDEKKMDHGNVRGGGGGYPGGVGEGRR